jgi:hypothetical protein
MPQFFETVMGHRFFEGDVPNIRRALKELVDATTAQTAALNRLAVAQERANELTRWPVTS